MLDMFNHSSTRPNSVVTFADGSVRVSSPASVAVALLDELTISYGNKSKVELLYHYGFIDNSAPDGVWVSLPLSLSSLDTSHLEDNEDAEPGILELAAAGSQREFLLTAIAGFSSSVSCSHESFFAC